MVEINEEYEKEIRSIINRYGPHWRTALESKGTDPKRHGPNRQHLINYIFARTTFLDNVVTNFKTRVVACLRHMTEVPCCKNPECHKPLPKYLIDDVTSKHPRETMFCSHECIYKVREKQDSHIHFNKQYPSKEEKVRFLKDLVENNRLSFQRILQGSDYSDIAQWIYDAVPQLQDKCYNTSTRLYWIINGLTDFPTCLNSGCENKIGVGKNIKYFQGYQLYCSKQCAANSELTKQHFKETCLKLYGVDNPWKASSVKQTIANTNLKKWGERYTAHVHEIVSKARKNIGYDGISFASIPEVAYYIWLKDNRIDFKYHPRIKLLYTDCNGKEHRYYPDFLVNGELQEIKGDQFFKEDGRMFAIWKPKNITEEQRNFLDDKEERKHQCMIDNNVRIIRGADYQPYIDYVNSKYGPDFLSSLKLNKKKD